MRDHLSKEKVINRGELPMYWIEDDHEPIVSKEQFRAVQFRLKQQSEGHSSIKGAESVFTSKIRCADCGKNYRRKTTPYRVVWCCSTFNSRGKKYCPTSKAIPEETLMFAAAEVLGLKSFDAETFGEKVEYIEAHPNNRLHFVFRNGDTVDYYWKDRSRSESWTPEMRAQVGQRTRERNEAHGK